MSLECRKLGVLLIMRDAPDTGASKGGLFPTAIKHHVDLGYDVYVASLSPVTKRHEDIVRTLGAKLFTPHVSFSDYLDPGRIKSMLTKQRVRGGDLTSAKAIAQIAREVSPDVVTGLQSYHSGMVAQKIARALNVPYVTWEHLSSYERSLGLLAPDHIVGQFFQESHAVLGVSSSLLRAINERFSIVLTNASVLPNPIPLHFEDPPKTDPPEWLERATKSGFVFASWTTWRKLKRLDVLLEAFALVAGGRDDVSLIVAGPVKEDVTDMIDAFSRDNPELAHRVVFTGRVDRDTIRHLAEATDCCVMSSDFETFGLQMIEAIAVGTPVISTRCGGPEDVLCDQRLGLLCDKGSAASLAAAMENVFDNQDAYQAEGIKQIAHEMLGAEAIKAKWKTVYKGIEAREC